jgi:predicted RNA-binding protein with EMAP domain
LKGWGFNISGNRKKRTKEIQEELDSMELLEEQSVLSNLQVKKKIEMMVEFLRLMEEELYWHRRCYETWLLKGDNNSEFFHRIANGSKRRQTIFSLQDGDVLIQGEVMHLSLIIIFGLKKAKSVSKGTLS